MDMLRKLGALCKHGGIGFDIVGTLRRRRSVGVRDLARSLGTSPTRVSRSLKDLGQAELVEQSPDSRQWRVCSQKLQMVVPEMISRMGMTYEQNNEASG